MKELNVLEQIEAYMVEGMTEEQAREAMRLASHKLPLKCKFVKKEEMEA